MTEPVIQITSLDPDSDAFQPLRRELGVTSFGMNKVTLGPKKRGRVHRLEHQEEVYLVLEGELLIALGGSGEHVGRDGRAWAGWDEEGEGRPPQEVPLPDDLPQ